MDELTSQPSKAIKIGVIFVVLFVLGAIADGLGAWTAIGDVVSQRRDQPATQA